MPEGVGESNIIEEVKVNGSPLTITNKSVNVTVPTVPIGGIKVGGTSVAPSSRVVDITFLPTTTTAPTSAWTGGGHKIVILSSEPATKYAGWIYLITAT